MNAIATALEGRGAGSAGERLAARYIAKRFRDAGLTPAAGGWEQRFSFIAVGARQPFKRLSSRNVVGILPGTDLGNEAVVVGGHFDGQGTTGQSDFGRLGEKGARSDRIWNSASDNATSIAALIEIVRELARSKWQPRRTIVFVAFSGEESRLNGSLQFVRDWPLAGITPVAMINLEKIVGHEPTEFITATGGSSPVFPKVTAMARERSGTTVKPFYDGIVTDTDHFPFLLAGIPGITIGTGAYERVHRSDDEIDTLLMENFANRVAYIQEFAKALADEPGPIGFSADVSDYSGIFGGEATSAELRQCGLKGPGFIVTEVARLSSGPTHQLRPGDIVVKVQGADLAFTDEGANMIEDVIAGTGTMTLRVECRGKVRETQLRIAHPPSP